MKDKRAEGLKQKRRREKMLEEERLINKIFEDFKEYGKSQGISKINASRKKVYLMKKQTEKEVIKDSILYSMAAVMYVLNTEFGFGKKRLIRYAERLKRIITAVGSNMRSLDKLSEEIKTETDSDIEKIFDFDGTNPRDKKAAAILSVIPKGMISCAYVLYFDFGFKHKRMTKALIGARECLIQNIGSGMERVTDYINRSCKIVISREGEVKYI